MKEQKSCCDPTDSELGMANASSSSGGPNTRSLLIIGGGSAAFAAATRAVELGAQDVIIVNDGLPIGGTCVNVGCVPSKTLIRAAEAVHRSNGIPFKGIKGSARVTDFAALLRQKQELVEELREAKYLDVVRELPQVRIIEGKARFTGVRTVDVNGEKITAQRILIATGSRPSIPSIPGLAECHPLTSQGAFELEELPESMIILGGRYVALECGQLFARLGTKVTILQRSERILPHEHPDLTDALTNYLSQEGIDVVTGAEVEAVEGGKEDKDVVVTIRLKNGERRSLKAARLLAATGRTPNTNDLNLEVAGVRLADAGTIKVDSALQTSAECIYAAGDVIGGAQYVYAAAYEGALAATNAMTNSAIATDYTALGSVVFTDPQVAAIGYDETQARAAGHEAESATLSLSHVPRCLAARDTRGFIRLIRDRKTDRLLGARILAPEGGELLMELAVAIRREMTVAELLNLFHPYLTLSEGIKLAAISFQKDVGQLSCCAV
jgi:mercuric reductase